tara:strand:- start:13205 stop:13366 length:162 start_codon:yes stop_codon:yes gene_type:complete
MKDSQQSLERFKKGIYRPRDPEELLAFRVRRSKANAEAFLEKMNRLEKANRRG